MGDGKCVRFLTDKGNILGCLLVVFSTLDSRALSPISFSPNNTASPVREPRGAGHAAAAVGKTTGRPGLCVPWLALRFQNKKMASALLNEEISVLSKK